jgi:hypothetical protein
LDEIRFANVMTGFFAFDYLTNHFFQFIIRSPVSERGFQVVLVKAEQAGAQFAIGCEPDSIAPGMGLSATVASSVERAVQLVTEIVHHSAHQAPAAAEAGRSGGG